MPLRASILAAFAAFAAFSAFAAAPAFALPSVTILADASMGAAVAEIARSYSREHAVVAHTAFTSAAAQEREINEGGSADVLITPRLSWIEQMKTQGLVDANSQASIARNRMALAGPVGSPLKVDMHKGFPTLALIREMAGEPGFVVGNPETLLEGVYGREALRSLGVSDDLEEYTLYVKHLDQMFDMVRGGSAYGIFFYSSTIRRDGVRVLDLLPETSHRPVIYDAVAIAGENMVEARKFIEYLKSATARKVLRENGFITE